MYKLCLDEPYPLFWSISIKLRIPSLRLPKNKSGEFSPLRALSSLFIYYQSTKFNQSELNFLRAKYWSVQNQQSQ